MRFGLDAGKTAFLPWWKAGFNATFVLLLAVSVITACKHDSSSEHIAAQVKSLGVYALSGNQLTEISAGDEEQRSFDGHQFGFKFTEPIMQVQPDTSFIVNIPDAIISDSKIFRLADVKSAKWHVFKEEDMGRVDPKPVKASIEPLGNGVYKVKPVETGSTSTPFLCLWVKMPGGTNDRFYALQIKN
jgi:hypothetical protein